MIPLAKPSLDGNERKYLLEAMDSGYLTHCGVWEHRFEHEFSQWIGRSSIACSSGTGALHIALMTFGIGPGDEVIVPALTFTACASVVKQLGANVRLCDVTEDFGINWDQAAKLITRRTKAIIAVHLYGQNCHVPGESFCGIPIIEDACEALGLVNPAGWLTAYSFYGNKPMTTGEGGMLCGKLGAATYFRDGGFDEKYDALVAGLNYRMTNLQAAIGCAQLERIDELVATRAKNAAHYAERIDGRGQWLFVAESRNPVSLAAYLQMSGIETRPVFMPLHLTRAFGTSQKFKVSESIWERGLCLPTGPHIGDEEIERICDLIGKHEAAEVWSLRKTA